MKILTLIFILVFTACNAPQPRITANPTDSASTIAQNSAPLPIDNSKLKPDEKKYIESSGGYLKGLFEEDKQLTQTATEVGQRTATLSDMKDAVTHAQKIESAGYFGDFGSPPVPKGYELLDAKIQKVHKMHVAFLKEYLEYWKDNNIEHINNAAEVEKAALTLTNDAIQQLTKIMNGKTK